MKPEILTPVKSEQFYKLPVDIEIVRLPDRDGIQRYIYRKKGKTIEGKLHEQTLRSIS